MNELCGAIGEYVIRISFVVVDVFFFVKSRWPRIWKVEIIHDWNLHCVRTSVKLGERIINVQSFFLSTA